MRERKQIIENIGDLIEEHCRKCKFNSMTNTQREALCRQCDIYKDIRALGIELEEKERK